MKRFAVFASGNGSNLQALIDKIEDGYIPAKIAIVVSDNRDAFALERAKKHKIEILVLNPKDFKTREAFGGEREFVHMSGLRGQSSGIREKSLTSDP